MFSNIGKRFLMFPVDFNVKIILLTIWQCENVECGFVPNTIEQKMGLDILLNECGNDR